MKQIDRKRVVSVLEAHTRRVTLSELAARGKKHVRVISGEKALELIEAVVDETIVRRVGELADEDRDGIVRQANEQFQRLTRLQLAAEELVQKQGGLIEKQAGLIQEQEGQITELETKAQRDTSSVADLESRFQAALDETIDRIGKVLQNVTARPIDHPVEATEALISNLFDQEHEMECNLSQLDVEVSTARHGIAGSLARLRQLLKPLGPDDEPGVRTRVHRAQKQ